MHAGALYGIEHSSTGREVTPLLIFLLQALIIVVLPPVLSHFLRLRIVTPLVVVQMLLGIALGPSIMGRIAPEAHALLFNANSLGTLSSISSVAVLLFAFTTGMHVQFSSLKKSGAALGLVGAASMLVPTVLGTLAGFWIALRYPAEMGTSGGRLEFAVGVGICSGVTALPVLAAILREMDLLKHRLGHFSLAIAAMTDGAVWILMGILLASVRTNTLSLGATATVVVLAAYAVVMFAIALPLLRKIEHVAHDDDSANETVLIVACGVALASAAATELLGLHSVLGAFVAGVIMPKELRKPLHDRIEPLTVIVLIPFFFISTGLKMAIDVSSSTFMDILLIITTFAILGKFCGTVAASRLSGEPWPFSIGLGALTQTKGLMEVVVVTILFDAHVVSQTVFSAVILMAVLSTTLAMPLTRWALLQERRATTSRA
jgi:Kef-type K+ transport system membrane component KefB